MKLLTLLLLPLSCFGQVVYDNATQGIITTGTVLTISHVTGSGSERAIAIGCVVSGDGTDVEPNISTVTYAGVSLTQLAKRDDNWDVYIWTLPDGTQPATGTNDAVITLASSMVGVDPRTRCGVVTASGVSQVSTWVASDCTGAGSSSSLSCTLGTSSQNDMLFSVACHGTSITGVGTGLTSRLSTNDGVNACGSIRVATGTGGTKSVAMTGGGADNWQILAAAFRSSVGAIAYHNSASSPADNGTQAGPGPLAVTPPTGMSSGDLVFIHGLYNAATVTIDISDAGGQTWTSETNRQGSGVTSRLFWCKFNGTWSANPSITNTTGTLALTAVMHVFRPITSTDTWTVDQAEATTNYTAPTTPFTVNRTGQTTTQSNTVSLAIWTSFDDNTWGSISGTGWNVPGNAQYRNLSGTDNSASYAYKVQSAAAATGDVSKNQATLGGDAGITHIITIYEAAGGAAPTHPGWLSVYGWK